MQSQTIPKETFIIVIFGGMIRGYDSHKSNFLPLLKTAPVKKRHSHIAVSIYCGGPALRILKKIKVLEYGFMLIFNILEPGVKSTKNIQIEGVHIEYFCSMLS